MDDLISRQAAIDALLRQTYQDGAYGYTDAKSIVDTLNALPPIQVQQMIPTQMSETSNYSTKFKPGDKFLLEIGEKRVGLDEYSIVGTDLYVWGSLLEKLTPYEPDGDAISRQDAIKALCAGCPENSDEECKFRKYVGGCPNYDFMTSLPSVQAEQKKGHWIPVEDPSITGRCSICGFESHLCEDDVYGYDYCPNCGVRLEVVDDE